ncbi:hypothetical protein IPA_08155 [Ignicoccus pacificus DSM 13166]|uniref:Uncharacterized protein n=1 Tax=Ignicoccus pacificus DSM 13166 TaxID=940294 RepID=A0A977KBX9_9CREN|nr:hypothetical protein IPA_08155 [Ignicoccus pacificus DSM 13166]
MDEERMRKEAEYVARMLERKGYETSVRKSVVKNLIGEEVVSFNVLASKGEHVVRWKVSENRYEVSIRIYGEVEGELEEEGYHVEKDGEYTRLFKRSNKMFGFLDKVP